ncbi:MAG: hypothetical protein R3C19_13455 [Planctomycetaceae bacterium]
MNVRILSLTAMFLAAVCSTTIAADHSASANEEVRSAGLFDSYPANPGYAPVRPLFDRPAYTGYTPATPVRPATGNCTGGVCPNNGRSNLNGYGSAFRPLFPTTYRDDRSAYGRTDLFGSPARPAGNCVGGNCATGSCANGRCGTGNCVNGSCAGGACSHGNHAACRDGSCGACANGRCLQTGYSFGSVNGTACPNGRCPQTGLVPISVTGGDCPNGNCNLRTYQPVRPAIPATLAPIGFGLFGRY